MEGGGSTKSKIFVIERVVLDCCFVWALCRIEGAFANTTNTITGSSTEMFVFITSSARKREAPWSHKNVHLLIANFVEQVRLAAAADDDDDFLVGDSLERVASDLRLPPGPKRS